MKRSFRLGERQEASGIKTRRGGFDDNQADAAQTDVTLRSAIAAYRHRGACRGARASRASVARYIAEEGGAGRDAVHINQLLTAPGLRSRRTGAALKDASDESKRS
jgi:hypothetical protein